MGKLWTKDEDDLIRKFYPPGRYDELRSALPHRTWASIRQRAVVLGIHRVGGGTSWTSEEDAIVRQWYPSGAYGQILERLPHRSLRAIKIRAHKLRLSRTTGRYVRRSIQEIARLKELYGNVPFRLVRRAIPARSRFVIHNKARELGLIVNPVLRRTYQVDRTYFDLPNVQNSYWAGFLAADGCVYIDKRRGYENLIVTLQARDREHLERFRQAIGYTGPILEFVRNGTYRMVRLAVHNVPELTRALARNFNVVPKKTLTLQPPRGLDDECALAFIAGLVDGDGSVHVGKPAVKIELVGTQDVLNWVRSYFDRLAPPRNGRVSSCVRPVKASSAWQYAINANRAISVARVLMSLPVPRLARKWDKLLPFVEGRSLSQGGRAAA